VSFFRCLQGLQKFYPDGDVPPGLMENFHQAVYMAAAAPDVRHRLDFSEVAGIDPALAQIAEARALHDAYESLAPTVVDIPTLVQALRGLQPAIDAFFDAVLVMADDPDLRTARLALVQHIAALPEGLADLASLRGF
jgi:glycyl-tRNA synthetase beta subunit